MQLLSNLHKQIHSWTPFIDEIKILKFFIYSLALEILFVHAAKDFPK